METQPFTNMPDTPPIATSDTTKEYQVQNMSVGSSLIFAFSAIPSIFLFIGIFIAVDSVVPHVGFVAGFIIGVAAVVCIMIALYRYLQRKILVTVGPGSIHIHYLPKPFFASKPDMNIVPADVESYKSDYFNGARFRLYLKNGQSFKVAVGSVSKTQRDAIQQMGEHIVAVVTDRQYSHSPATTSEPPPRRRATYAEGTKGLVLAIIVIAVMIAMVIAIIFFPENHNTGDTVYGIGAMFGGLAFVLRVFTLRSKAKKEKEEQAGK